MVRGTRSTVHGPGIGHRASGIGHRIPQASGIGNRDMDHGQAPYVLAGKRQARRGKINCRARIAGKKEPRTLAGFSLSIVEALIWYALEPRLNGIIGAGKANNLIPRPLLCVFVVAVLDTH